MPPSSSEGFQTRGCAAPMRSRRTRWGVGEGLSCRARGISQVCWCPLVVMSNHPAYEAGTSALSDVGATLVGSPCPRHASEGRHPDARLRRAHAQSAHTVGAWARVCQAERSPRFSAQHPLRSARLPSPGGRNGNALQRAVRVVSVTRARCAPNAPLPTMSP